MRLAPEILASRATKIRHARAWSLSLLDPAADALPEPPPSVREPSPCAKCGGTERYANGGRFGPCVPCRREESKRNKRRARRAVPR